MQTLGDRVTQFALGSGATPQPMGSMASTPGMEAKMMEYERKLKEMALGGGGPDEGQFKKLKEQVKKQKEKQTEDSHLLKELEMRFNSMQKN